MGSPFIGYGINTYPYIHKENAGLPLGDSYGTFLEYYVEISRLGYIPEVMPGITINPHNVFLASMLDMGMMGPLLILLFYFYFIRKAIRLIVFYKKRDNDFRYCTALSLLSLIIAVLIKSYFEFFSFYKTAFNSVFLSMIISLLIVMDEATEKINGKR